MAVQGAASPGLRPPQGGLRPGPPPHSPNWTGGCCVCPGRTAPAPRSARGPPTLAVQADVHDTMLDFHVPAQVSLEVELAGAVGALEGFAARVQVHVSQQVVHPVEGLPAHLEHTGWHISPGSPPSPSPRPLPPHSLGTALTLSFLCDPRGPRHRESSLLAGHCSWGLS